LNSHEMKSPVEFMDDFKNRVSLNFLDSTFHAIGNPIQRDLWFGQQWDWVYIEATECLM